MTVGLKKLENARAPAVRSFVSTRQRLVTDRPTDGRTNIAERDKKIKLAV